METLEVQLIGSFMSYQEVHPDQGSMEQWIAYDALLTVNRQRIEAQNNSTSNSVHGAPQE